MSDVSLPVVRDKRALRPSRASRWRAGVLVVVQLLIVAHIVQWAITGRTLAPLEPSESMETVKRGVVNAGAILFASAIVSTLVLGRWFCGWGCHVVMLQDGCAWLMRRAGIRPKPFRSRVLVWVPFVLALYMFVWPVVYRWGVAPLLKAPLPAWGGFHLELTTTDFWQTFPGVFVAVPFFLICGFGTVYLLGSKGFCTYGCPYGGFFAPAEHYAPGRIRVTDACEHCGHCTAACTSNVRVHEEVREFGMVVDPGCMKCLDCVSVCPNDALFYGFGRPASAKGRAKHAEPKRTYDLTGGEELACAALFLLVFLAVRGVYDVVPMLMAVGIAACLTFAAWKLWRMTRDASVSLHRFRLRFRGTVTRSGAVFAVVVVAALLLTAHSGALNIITRLADRADRRVTLPREAIFAAAPHTMSPDMARHADRAIRLYELAAPVRDGGIGLLGRPASDARLAWLHACRHEFDVAERLLRRLTERAGPSDAVVRDIALLRVLQLDEDGAQDELRSVTAEHPELVLSRDWLILARASVDDFEDAIRLARAGVEGNADRPHERLFMMRRLSLLLLESGAIDEAVTVIRDTIEIDPTSAHAHAVLGRAEQARGNTEAAIAALERAVELAPDDEAIRAQLDALR